LIASDYLSSQGSVPPTITNANGGSGSIFAYTSTSNTITMLSQAFTVLYPNGSTDIVPAASGVFSVAKDTLATLVPSTTYGFFPSLKGPTTDNPNVEFNGPYFNYANTAASPSLSGMYQDGSVPLVNSAFVAQTAPSSGAGGGGGGGTWGGGSCGTLNCKIMLANGKEITLSQLRIGDIVIGINGKPQRVCRTILRKEPTSTFEVASGLKSRSSLTHTLRYQNEWITLAEAIALNQEGEEVTLETMNSREDRLVSFQDTGEDWILQLELGQAEETEECDHTYILDGFRTHNFMVKGN